MRRYGSLFAATVVLFALAAMGGAAAGTDDYGVRNCSQGNIFCAETADSIGYNGAYTGHDEPSLLFYSNTPGSGNSTQYRVQLPTDPKQQPKQDGSGATWNFQLHPAFWFGMALCDNQSGPNFTHAPCTPDSDTNIFDGTDPAGADYIGRHPGTAFLEVQFYPPGWAALPAAVSCDATQWCAAMAIFSLNQDQNSGTLNNASCLNSVGLEPANYAFITKSGVPHAPPDPITAITGPAFTPDPATDLFMNAGDVLTLDIHDSPAGLVVAIDDETTGQKGSMTASAANGFAQVLYQPTAATCSEAPYTFHPMYATSSEHTRVPWAAHSYNVAASDEIGHFEYCSAVDEKTNPSTCTANNEGAIDDDDNTCFEPDDSLLVPIGGCIGALGPTDGDFDGESYQPNWPGTGSNSGQDQKYHPSPFTFTSPLFNGSQNYSRVAFEADLPRIEAPDSGGTCNRFDPTAPGSVCVNPPPGSNFYPIYTTASASREFMGQPGQAKRGGCVWQFGGPNIRGTTNDFGGNSAAEFGPLLFTFYPGPNPATRLRTNNFRQVLGSNPCPA